MESFQANSTSIEDFSPTTIDEVNEVLPTQHAKVSISLPSPQIKRIQRHLTIANGSNFSWEQSFTPQKDSIQLQGSQSDLKKRLVPSMFTQTKTKQPSIDRPSITDERLKEIIQNLHDHPIDEEIFDEKQSSAIGCNKYIGRSRKFLRHLMEQPRFHYIIIVLIIIDLIIVFIELTLGNSVCFLEPVLTPFL